jgi:caffeoyl-CoA O-methyltransferase
MPGIEEYAQSKSERVSDLLEELIKETHKTMDLPQMLSGPLEGNFLRLLVQISGAKNILEIGMFTGFSALSMAAGLPPDGKLTTLEIDPKCIEMGRRYFARSEHGTKITIKEGAALESLRHLPGPFDFVFIDADKTNYINYYKDVVPKVVAGGLIAVDNVLWGGAVLDPKEPSDRAIAVLNNLVVLDDRVDKVLLTIRDGVFLIRKR